MQNKVPVGEIEASYTAAQSADDGEAAAAGAARPMRREFSFNAFVALLREPSRDSLELYDDRHE